MSAALTRTESARLAELEKTVKRGLETFAEVGLALAEIRESRLYRQTHDRFEDYCRGRWGFSRQRAHQHIDAAQIAGVLSTTVDATPANEAQARELVPLKDDEVALVDTWRELRAEYGEAVTAERVRQAVRNEARWRARREAARNLAPVEIPPPYGEYPVLLVDPPWRYEGVTTPDRAVENHYPTMPLDGLKQLALPAADDAVLFMWATTPKLAEAVDLMDAWGFTYRTGAVWVKDKIGMGHYFRQRHELLLLGRRGTLAVPEPSDRPDSVIEAPRGKHSAKPPEVYGLIERMYPGLPYIELFARAHRPGWDVWGSEAPEAVAA